MGLKVFGPRVLVEREKIDLGDLVGTPAVNEGQKNRGVIVGVGQVGILARLRGIREGKVIYFKKHFNANDGLENPRLFVDIDNILSVE